MPSKAVITTPFPTVRETAREVGVADKRVRLLRKLITSIVASRAKRKVAAKGRVTKRKRATPR